jgi:prostaglandin-endoperoxide synthase 2
VSQKVVDSAPASAPARARRSTSAEAEQTSTTSSGSNGRWGRLPGRGALPVPFVQSAISRVLDVPMPGLPSRSAPTYDTNRSTAKDGLDNQIEAFVTTHGTPVWKLVQSIRPLRLAANRMLTNLAIMKFPTRPNPFTTMADYTSWASLTDRTWSSRHLPAATYVPARPDADKVVSLFTREEFVESPKSTVLFSLFAQWFTDGFLRSDRGSPGHPPDPRRNESNHDIDLTNLYGLNADVARQLRALEGGLMKSQQINDEEYPLYLCQGGEIKPEFSLLKVYGLEEQPVEKRDKLFAMGSDTSNLQIGFVMHNVLFLREHNRIARELAAEYPDWDDERLFATTRNILTVILVKIVIEDYINHITPTIFRICLEPRSFPNEPWYRQNWMAIEFDLLYRWHSLVPPTYSIAGETLSIAETLYNTETVTGNGLGRLFEDASHQVAGQIALGNTASELWEVELAGITRARDVQLRSYNDYRELGGFPRVTEFDQITGNVKIREQLRRVYGHVDDIEFFVGLFAEDVAPNGVLPPLMGSMVALDAFSQVYTNPLLAPRVYNEETFSPVGMKLIKSTTTLSQIVNRNVTAQPGGHFVSMTRKDWKRV